jgi:ABC-type phosphate/phosphonate transport system substrate-binding protein
MQTLFRNPVTLPKNLPKKLPKNLTIALTLGVLVFSACAEAPTETFSTPTPIPTPLSTALPPIETEQPLGTEARPYRFVIMLSPDAGGTGSDLQDRLNADTGVVFNVETEGISGEEALNALCGGVPTFAWVDGWTMLAAISQGCAEPVLQIARETGSGRSREEVTGISSDIVIGQRFVANSLSDLQGQAFCRTEASDVAGWVLPVMSMRSFGFDPLNSLSVRDYGEIDGVIREVLANTCAAAIPSGTARDLDVPGLDTSTLRVLDSTPELPFGGLVVSDGVQPALRDQIVELFANEPELLDNLVEADALVEPETTRLRAMRELIESARMGFIVVGR